VFIALHYKPEYARQRAEIGGCMYRLPGSDYRNRISRKTFLITKILFMKPNMGNTDRIIRVLLAAVFAYLYFSGTVTGIFGIILVVLGGVFVLTSVVSFCPLYTLLGINTCKRKQA
jgi:Protein of unknown function (DUF2892)